ncbi:hypothetical protein HHX47_DHR2000669 [Lentinula edodes]|nr:hypothetical protein HHX47_DHR2000669 [Lentinula edodes]
MFTLLQSTMFLTAIAQIIRKGTIASISCSFLSKSSKSHKVRIIGIKNELSEIFSAAPPPPQLRGSFIANKTVVGAWREATGRAPVTTTTQVSDDPRRIPVSEDDCPICYDKMNAEELDLKGLEKILEWCNECHNAVHKECWTQWRTTKQRQAQSLTCVYCRSDWVGAASSARGLGGSAARFEEGFVNLANVSGVSTIIAVLADPTDIAFAMDMEVAIDSYIIATTCGLPMFGILLRVEV